MRKFQILLLFFIVFLGILLRLYRFDSPIADWHSWRQSDTSAVSRNFIKSGLDLLHPTYDDISNIQTGYENPKGYRFVEFPIYNFFQAGTFFVTKDFIPFTLEQWGRIVTIFSSVVTSIFLFLLVGKYSNKKVAFLALFFYLTLPYSVFYGRVLLPDPFMVMSIMGGIYFFDKWLSLSIQYSVSSIKYLSLFFLAVVFTSMAILIKPFALFFTIPMIYLAIKKFGFLFLTKWQFYLFLVLSVTPFAFWRFWMLQFPEGIPASSWLFNGGGIRFKGAFFYWIFAQRISQLILGYFGIALIVFGLVKKESAKHYYFFVSFLLSSLIYLFVIARGNVQHDYYQILIIPTISMFLALGVYEFYAMFKNNKIIGLISIFTFVGFTYAFSFFQVRDYFNINNENIVVAGKKADALLPKEALVIAAYDGDTTFLYQINRKGWPAFTDSIEELIKKGAQYLVIANPTKSDFDGFGKNFKPIASSEAYLILRLK